jgi:hypothetical protein
MGYLQDLEQQLRELLGELDEAKQKDIAQFVRTKVYESWKNGVEHGKASAKLDRLGKALADTGADSKRRAGRRASGM